MKPFHLYLPGFLGSPDDWAPHASVSILDYSLDSFDAWSKDFYKQWSRYEVVDITGYSMGGRLALYLKQCFPNWIRHLCVIAADPGDIDDPILRYQQDCQWAYRFETDSFGHVLSDWYDQPLFDSFKKSRHYSFYFLRRLKEDPIKWARALRVLSVAKQPNLWPVCIEEPLVYVVGEKDKKYGDIASKIRLLNPQARVEILPDIGHVAHLERQQI